MFRLIAYLFLFVILISLARGVIGIVSRAFSAAMRASSGPNEGVMPPRVPATGELKKDPVCGTYISTATTHTRVADGTTFYFCSPECRSRFKAQSL